MRKFNKIIFSAVGFGLSLGLLCVPSQSTEMTEAEQQQEFAQVKYGVLAEYNKNHKINLRNSCRGTLPSTIGSFSLLKTLDLSLNFITSIPTEIGKLSVLEELNLHAHSLKFLPTEIGMLTALTNLNLSGGTDHFLTDLPTEVGNLKALVKLDLRYNRLTHLPTEIGNLKALQEFNIMYNLLTDLPTEIGNLEALVKLNSSYNKLTDLPYEMNKLLKLKDLHLEGNQLEHFPFQFRKIALSDLNLRNIGEADIGDNLFSKFPFSLERIYLNSSRQFKIYCNNYFRENRGIFLIMLGAKEDEQSSLSVLPHEIVNMVVIIYGLLQIQLEEELDKKG